MTDDRRDVVDMDVDTMSTVGTDVLGEHERRKWMKVNESLTEV